VSVETVDVCLIDEFAELDAAWAEWARLARIKWAQLAAEALEREKEMRGKVITLKEWNYRGLM
jgi:hypothetical protein